MVRRKERVEPREHHHGTQVEANGVDPTRPDPTRPDPTQQFLGAEFTELRACRESVLGHVPTLLI